MPDFDPSAPVDYNSMQQQAGLAPPQMQFAPTIFPGQVSAALAQGGPSAVSFITQGSAGTSFGAGMFPGQQLQGFTNQAPMFQGPTGVMMPMSAAATFNPYGPMNPYAGLSARGPYMGAPGLFTPMAPMPPPAYAGQMAQAPFTPPPAASQFNMAYAAELEQQQALADSSYLSNFGYGGVGARIGANAVGGIGGAMLGANLGRRIGGRFGMAGAAIGGLAGFFGSEALGVGNFAQNTFMNQIATPFIQQRAIAGGIEELSQEFVNAGPSLHARGRGFSHHAAAEVARGLRDMANSSQFQQQTGERFNQQDLLQITQSAARSDLMTGVQSSGQMVSRVRDIAKSLTSFMELAQEPDIQRAISTMGQLRSSGLNLNETTRAVAQGRQFARMAGTTFGELMDVGGALGSQTFQSMGLTQGLGLQAGMQNYALARGAQLGGTISPQLMNLVGGAQGLGNLNNLFSASTLQMSMLAPSVMSASGGVNMGALQNLIGGGTNAFSQTTSATAALQAMTGRQGVGGLGMAIAMQPLMQDTIGRALQAQGPFAQRNFEDRNILNTMRQMGQSGAGGFATVGMALGLGHNQAIARLHELSDPAYYERQRAQIETTRRENRRAELDRYEQERPGFLDEATRIDSTGILRGIRRYAARRQLSYRHLGHLGAEMAGISSPLEYENAENARDLRSTFDRDLRGAAREVESAMRPQGLSLGRRLSTEYSLSEARGNRGLVAAFDALSGLYNAPGDQEGREERVREARNVGRFADTLLNTSSQRERAALRNRSAAFGAGPEGLNRAAEFAVAATRALRGRTGGGLSEEGGAALNLGVRGLAQYYSRGMIDPGNLVGRADARQADLEQAYVVSMRGSGRREEEVRRYFREHAPEIAEQSSSLANLIMTPEQRAASRDTAQRGQALAGYGDTGFVEAARGRQREGVQGMFGRGFQATDTNRQAVRGIFDRAAALGEFGANAAERRASREAMATMAMYQAVIANPRTDPATRRRAEEQLAKIGAHLETRFGPDRADRMRRAAVQNSNQIATDINQNPEQAAAAEAFVRETSQLGTPGEVLNRVSQGRERMHEGEALERISGGAASLSQRGGALGELFEGIGGRQFSMSRLEDRIGQLSEERLQELSRGDDKSKEVARAARLMRSDDRDQQARGRILMQRALGGGGDEERERRLRREYGARFHGIGGFFRGLGRSMGIGATEEEFVQEGLMQGTAADAEANRQSAAVDAAQRDFTQALGGSGNELLQATSELREAARALQGAVAGRGLDNLLP